MGVNCTDLAQDGDTWKPVVNMVIKVRVPQNMVTTLTKLETISFSRNLHRTSDSYLYAYYEL
jgi:hypothetical protein